MTIEKPVHTIAGAFDRNRYKALKETIKEADKCGISDDEITLFEGQELVIKYGKYLLQYLDQKFAERGHGPL